MPKAKVKPEVAVTDDPKTSSKECLKCFEKHLGESIVLLGEISDRFVGKLDPDDTHVKEDMSDAMKQLGAAERHVQQVTSTTDPQKLQTLKTFGAEARALRGTIRDMREQYAHLTPEARVAAINEMQLRAKALDKNVRSLLEKEPCTKCQAIDPLYSQQLRAKVEAVTPTPMPKQLPPPVASMLPTSKVEPLQDPLLLFMKQIKTELETVPKTIASDLTYLLTGSSESES